MKYVWLFLALVPEVRRGHRERGIHDALYWANLGLLGEVMREDRRLTVFGVRVLRRWLLWAQRHSIVVLTLPLGQG